jgi:hypothetical protein
MRRFRSHLLSGDNAAANGPALIGVGLAALVAAMVVPGVPAVAAMAVVTLGATGVFVERYRGAAGLVPMLLAHLMVYSSMYALFVGATLHAAATTTAGGVTVVESVDLVVSMLPIVMAWRLAWSALAEQGVRDP